MALKYLVDTNIFLEILLAQEKCEACKEFLAKYHNKLAITDFSLHSIGVILFRHKREQLFFDFTSDVLPNLEVVTMSIHLYTRMHEVRTTYRLDFDDAYQFLVAKEEGLTIVTMDKDFERVSTATRVRFL